VNIIIIGAGNVASHLGRAFKEAGHTISGIYNHHHSEAAENLAETLDSKFSIDFQSIEPADIYILAVKDDVIEEIAKQINISSGIILHTSGTVSIDVLNKFTEYGVFYPVQTFSKNIELDYKCIPVCIEANNPLTQKTLKELVRTFTNEIHYLDSEKRLKLHLAAVFVNNFTNHLFAVAADILKKNDLHMDILKPLSKETLQKIFDNPLNIEAIQTGPAKRKDRKTIQAHLELLQDFPEEYRELYRIFTQHIQQIKD
jgi:predicted short-subunit dehydrogenase-like oxidoreductase (DUF2520 family)